jgi:methionine aminotransferase
MPNLQSKLPAVGTTIFTEMSVLAQRHQAINLGQGFPDFEMDATLIDLVNEAMRSGQNQYVHMCGLPLLRQRISEKVNRAYGSNIDAETEITITPGGTYALYTAITTLVRPGDEVIYFEPAYDSYLPNIEINGGIPVPIPLSFPDYQIDWNRVKETITPKTKAIIINTPHNPTGKLFAASDRDQLRDIAEQFDLWVISDEVYEHLVFEDQKHHSVLADPVLSKRSFACFSFGKVYHCTGWKTGYCIAPASLMKEFRKVHQFLVFTCHGPSQHGLAAYLSNESAYLNLGKFLQSKRDYFNRGMESTPLQPLPSYGSYFQLYRFDGISELSEREFAIALTEKAGVATIPVSAFYKNPQDNRVLRFCFAKKESTLDMAIERLNNYFANH